jgi:hypothetical protein
MTKFILRGLGGFGVSIGIPYSLSPLIHPRHNFFLVASSNEIIVLLFLVPVALVTEHFRGGDISESW